jgi:hypothetical protein
LLLRAADLVPKNQANGSDPGRRILQPGHLIRSPDWNGEVHISGDGAVCTAFRKGETL